MLAKKNRLSSNEMRILKNKKGVSCNGSYMRIVVYPSDVNYSKSAVVVSKKVAPRAVDRNRLRRQVYACIQRAIVGQSKIYIVYLQKNIRGAKNVQICDEVQALCNKA